MFRSYGVLQPQRVARPRGDRSFALARSSTVEIYINGQLIRRLRLDPGTYNLRDFPFTQGANDVVVSIEDDTGSRQTLRFNMFFDRTQLERGLTEFGLYAGVASPLQASGPDYTNDVNITGFYRVGATDDLTIGSNLQVDRHTRLGGIEGVVGTKIGTVGFDFGLSDVDGFGSGRAMTLTFQRLFQHDGNRASSLNLFFEARSRWFGSLGVTTPDNRFEYEAGGAWSQAINDRIYAGLDARYSRGRDANPDIASYRATLGWRATPRVGFTFDALYEDQPGERNLAFMVSMTTRLSAFSSLRADYDSRDDRARVSWQALHGQGVGAYNMAADVERTPKNSGVNASLSYLANRAELGASHFSTFDGDFGSATDQRTTFRVATALAVADGAFSIGRPVYDSFAIVKPYKGLQDVNVVVNPTPFGYTSASGKLGTALETSLTAYTERTVTVDVQGAPAGYDLGAGAWRLFPPYRGGYRLEVGSAYSVTAIGRLLGADGAPVALLAGKAYEVAEPTRDPVLIFTNREGRFGASGLRPGKWRIVMPTEPETAYVLEVPDRAIGAVRVGDLLPSQTGK
jgi:outer membrane usher protein